MSQVRQLILGSKLHFKQRSSFTYHNLFEGDALLSSGGKITNITMKRAASSSPSKSEKETAEDAITENEIQGTTIPGQESDRTKMARSKHKSDPDSHRNPKNAFAELMSPKKPKPTTSDSSPKPKYSQSLATRVFKNRDGLGAYTAAPASFPSSRVVHYNDEFVVIHDLYPKATVHLLLLTRDEEKAMQHPFTALADAKFLAKVKTEAEKVKGIVASELRRKFGQVSVKDRERNAAMQKALEDSDAHGRNGELEPLPAGRDWSREVKVGVHAHPSMSHLHIHVLSRDMHSSCLKHRKHYNSFNTGFFVPLEAFPLAQDDPRWNPGRQGFLNQNFSCWRCSQTFGNKFQKLKDHLAVEFESWKIE